MPDFAFYNAGCENAKGPRRLLVLIRRGLRRILRPIFFRQEALYRELQTQIDALTHRQEQLAEQLSASAAFGWDYVALARRLAAIEDHLEASSALSEPQHDSKPNPVRFDGPSRHEPVSRDFQTGLDSRRGPEPSSPLRESR